MPTSILLTFLSMTSLTVGSYVRLLTNEICPVVTSLFPHSSNLNHPGSRHSLLKRFMAYNHRAFLSTLRTQRVTNGRKVFLAIVWKFSKENIFSDAMSKFGYFRQYYIVPIVMLLGPSSILSLWFHHLSSHFWLYYTIPHQSSRVGLVTMGSLVIPEGFFSNTSQQGSTRVTLLAHLLSSLAYMDCRHCTLSTCSPNDSVLWCTGVERGCKTFLLDNSITLRNLKYKQNNQMIAATPSSYRTSTTYIAPACDLAKVMYLQSSSVLVSNYWQRVSVIIK